MTDEFNVHCAVTKAEYERILRHARSLGKEPKVTFAHDGITPLFATLDVKLYVSPSESRSYTSVAIHDRTYSREVFRLERIA